MFRIVRELRRRIVGVAVVVGAMLVPLAAPVPAYASWADSYEYTSTVSESGILYPEGVDVDAAGNVYVVDAWNAIVWKIDAQGSTVASWGPELEYWTAPSCLALDSAGNIYVTDNYEDKVVVIDADGEFVREWGSPGSGNGQFSCPYGIAVYGSTVYVADTLNNRVQAFTTGGSYIGSIINSYYGFLSNPCGVACDSFGNIYVADTSNDRVHKYTPGRVFVSSIGGFGTDPGKFDKPEGVTCDNSDAVIVVDTLNARVQKFTNAHEFVCTFGSEGSEHGQFYLPEDVASTADGNLYVADSANDRVEFYTLIPGEGDFIPPVTTSNIPEVWGQAPFDVSLTATDSASGVAATYISTTGQNPPTTPYTAPVQLSQDGTYTVTHYSVDNADNAETVNVETLRIDGTPPVTLSDVETLYQQSATINFFPSDSHSGVDTTYYKIGEGEWIEGSQLTTTAPGTHTLYYYSVDNAGNDETPNDTMFTVQVTGNRFEDNNSLLIYEGIWSQREDINLSAEAYSLCNDSGAAVNIAFSGTAVDWITCIGPAYGKATVILDDWQPQTVDLYAETIQYQTSAWSAADLNPGDHLLRIEWTGQKNELATNTYVGVDAIDVMGELIQAESPVNRYEQTDSRMLFEGKWSNSTNANLSMDTYKFCNDPGSAANISFHGSRFDWITVKGPIYGKANVIIDDGTPVLVDLYAADFQYQAQAYSVLGLTTGDHIVRIEWTGQKNAASSNTYVGVDAVDVVGSLTQAYFQQNNPKLLYEGEWSPSAGIDHSGGSYKFTNKMGAGLNVAFFGTQFDWITVKGPIYGIANVSVDNGTPVQVDLYSPAFEYQQVAWSAAGLSSGPHVIRIDFTGQKNASASNNYVGFDCMSLLGSIEQAHFEQNNPKVIWEGSWSNGTSPDLSGGTYRFTNNEGAAAHIQFSGTGMDWISCTGPLYGIASVRVDNGAPVNVDLYAAAIAYKTKVWSVSGLSQGPHTVDIVVTHTKNPSATNYYVGLDAFDFSGVIQQARYEQTDSRLFYEGTWSNSSNASFSGGSYKFNNTLGGAVNVAFNGTGLDWVTAKGPIFGKAYVSVDNGTPVLVDLYSSAFEYQKTVWSVTGLTPDAHTVRIEWSGQKNPAATNTYVGIDGVNLASGTLTQATSPVTRYEQDNAYIGYTGQWPTYSGPDLSGGSYKYTNSVEGSVTVSFNGTKFSWITVKGPLYGIASVSIDSADPVMVDLYDSSFRYKQTAWTVSGLADTLHTVVIRWTGNKNAAATNTYVGIDAVDLNIGGTLAPVP